MTSLTNFLSSSLQTHWGLAYIISFLSGVLVSFTPCIYPLLPITVGFITLRGGHSKVSAFWLSVFFVTGTAIVYSALGVIASLSGKLFGQMQVNPISFFIVGNISLILGLGSLDVFHLPVFRLSKLTPSTSKDSSIMSDSKTLTRRNIFFALCLGMTGGLVISPCTTPVLGVLLFYVSTQRNIFLGATLIFIFALGMGTLLIIVGTFSSLLNRLPKAGRWNLGVKKVLGWMLIAYAEFLFLKAGKLM